MGLNLTRATLRATLTYPWTYGKRQPDPKSGEPINRKLSLLNTRRATQRVVEFSGPLKAELMDWADDLWYSVRDVEDFYRAGLVPLHLLRPKVRGKGSDDPERERLLQYVWAREDRICELKQVTEQELDNTFRQLMTAYFRIEGAYDGTRDPRARLRTFTSSLVNRYINEVSLDAREGQTTLKIDELKSKELAILKH
jgi:dGTPase